MKKKFIVLIFFCSFFLVNISTTFSQIDKNDVIYLETIANVVGHDLYLSYINIGYISDAYILRVYKQKVVLTMLNEYVDYISIMIKQMENLSEKKLIPLPDTPYVNKQIEAYKTMKQQALEFIKYVETGEIKYVETFESLRLKAWSLIATVLGIPEVEEKVYKK